MSNNTKSPSTIKITQKDKEASRTKEPPTFAGFKDLKSLAVLDMDTLDYVSDVATCVRNSSSTLNKLKLSFSEDLASKARKAGIEDSDDSDQDIEEFGNTLGATPPNTGNTEGMQEKEARIRAEKVAQEAVIGRIFGLDKTSPLNASNGKDSKGETANDKDKKEGSARTDTQNILSLIEKVLEAAKRTEDSSKMSLDERQKLKLNLLEALKKFEDVKKSETSAKGKEKEVVVSSESGEPAAGSIPEAESAAKASDKKVEAEVSLFD